MVCPFWVGLLLIHHEGHEEHEGKALKMLQLALSDDLNINTTNKKER